LALFHGGGADDGMGVMVDYVCCFYKAGPGYGENASKQHMHTLVQFVV
jgi:hypothetical protein